MASSKSPAKYETGDNQDLISNLPTVLSDKILKRLPLSVAAKTSVLSRHWRLNWYFFGFLVFDKAFSIEQNSHRKPGSLQQISGIISNIVFLQKGPVYKFHLEITEKYLPEFQQLKLDIKQWLSFLSGIGVKKIIILNYSTLKPLCIPSHIYAFKHLEKLRIESCILVSPPSDFKGFEFLRNLELVDVQVKVDTLNHLIANCPILVVLRLVKCSDISNLVIDAPSLEQLTIKTSVTKSIALKNVQRLNHASLHLDRHVYLINPIVPTHPVKVLGSLSELQSLRIGGWTVFKLLGSRATQFIEFSHLQKLCLKDIDLGDFDGFCFVFDILQNCQFIKDLHISVKYTTSNKNAEQKFEYNESHKLGHLQKVIFKGIIGSSAELKVIEYVFSISTVLEVLVLKSSRISEPSLKMEMALKLLSLTRASSKAKLVWLD